MGQKTAGMVSNAVVEEPAANENPARPAGEKMVETPKFETPVAPEQEEENSLAEAEVHHHPIHQPMEEVHEVANWEVRDQQVYSALAVVVAELHPKV